MTFLPIVERELRVAARKPGTYWLRFFAALAVALLFLCAFFGNARSAPASLAKEMFEITTGLTFAGCLFAGAFQTADCLSSEKRDGTLGLLFLTDLRSYDVVLGKLVSSSTHAFYGLLSILPLLALPLLMGGVTVGEFWRMALVLVMALLFSLSVGMLASALTRDSRIAFGLTVFVVLLLTAVLPTIYGVLKALHSSLVIPYRPMLWPGLGYAYGQSGDAYYHYRGGQTEFWGSIVTVLSISTVCLFLASVVLPYVWQERSRGGTARQGFWQRLRFGSARRRRVVREKILLPNPFYWLTVRDRLPRFGVWLLIILVLPFWLTCICLVLRAILGSPQTSGMSAGVMPWYEYSIFTTFLFSVTFKSMVALEASRRLNDDRHSGALELLLASPLPEKWMVAGQIRALWRQFWLPVLLLLFFFTALLWANYFFGSRRFSDPSFVVVMSGNIVALITDFIALQWVGMWTGLRARQHYRAVLATLARILFIPWLLYLIMGFTGFFDGSVNSINNGFVCWFALCVINDLFWTVLARRGLRKQFRPCAAGLSSKMRRATVPPTLQTNRA